MERGLSLSLNILFISFLIFFFSFCSDPKHPLLHLFSSLSKMTVTALSNSIGTTLTNSIQFYLLDACSTILNNSSKVRAFGLNVTSYNNPQTSSSYYIFSARNIFIGLHVKKKKFKNIWHELTCDTVPPIYRSRKRI